MRVGFQRANGTASDCSGNGQERVKREHLARRNRARCGSALSGLSRHVFGRPPVAVSAKNSVLTRQPAAHVAGRPHTGALALHYRRARTGSGAPNPLSCTSIRGESASPKSESSEKLSAPGSMTEVRWETRLN